MGAKYVITVVYDNKVHEFVGSCNSVREAWEMLPSVIADHSDPVKITVELWRIGDVDEICALHTVTGYSTESEQSYTSGAWLTLDGVTPRK